MLAPYTAVEPRRFVEVKIPTQSTRDSKAFSVTVATIYWVNCYDKRCKV